MDDLIKYISGLQGKVGKAPTKGQLRAAHELLDVARDDLKASKLTYDGGVFIATASHVQQAVEKTAKAYYKILGVLDDKTIRDTSHDSPELFLRMLELPWAQEFGKLAGEFTGSDVATDTSDAQSVVDTQAKRAEIARLDAKQINNYLSLIPKLEEKLLPLFSVMNKDLIMAMLRLYLLSGVTFPHEQYPRYPDSGVVKPKEYTAE
ncbi:MAG TPA: HEPN domain-containing protein, partial [Dehalococcoidia bacterium]|nr:HEPN domain-containing protein [Dehalococcoidia bacterium]